MALFDLMYYFGLMALLHGPLDPLNDYVKTLQMTSDPDTYLTPVSDSRLISGTFLNHYCDEFFNNNLISASNYKTIWVPGRSIYYSN